jgi:hypothetical protein
VSRLVESKVLADKVLRDSTKAILDRRIEAVKLDLEARGIGGRIADEIVGRAKTVVDEAVEITEEHPGVIGGTIAALVLWTLRNPIIDWLDEFLGPRR